VGPIEAKCRSGVLETKMQKAVLGFGIKYCLPEAVTLSREPRAAQEAARLLRFRG